jgi:UDP-N-acetylglucosamine:LPS N-acetylglucosamine transferase
MFKFLQSLWRTRKIITEMKIQWCMLLHFFFLFPFDILVSELKSIIPVIFEIA